MSAWPRGNTSITRLEGQGGRSGAGGFLGGAQTGDSVACRSSRKRRVPTLGFRRVLQFISNEGELSSQLCSTLRGEG